MSNINKQAVQAVADLKAGYTLGHADVAILNELARIALASLEAEPVAWLLSGGGAKNHVSFDSGNAYADPLREVTPLYTAPPAPVALPSGYSDFEEIWSSSTHPLTQDDEMKDFAWDIWNACRAAMLQGAEPVRQPLAFFDGDISPEDAEKIIARLREMNSRPGSQQVMIAEPVSQPCTLRDGWVTVPADMTPDMMREVQLNSELGAYAAANLSGAYSLFREFWGIACRAAGNYPAIPEGYVLVPIEPTAEMCDVKHVGVDVYTGIAADEYYSIGGEDAAKVWKAMLAAAPNQEAK